MKKTLSLITLLLTMLSGFSQRVEESAVPDSVKLVFKQQYPEVTSVRWEKEKSGDYEVNFRVSGNKNSVTYSKSGKVLETEIEITTSSLPKAALDYVTKNYPGEEIQDVFKITLENGTVNYEVELEGKELFFDANGKFIK